MVSKQTVWERLYLEVVFHIAFALAIVNALREAWAYRKRKC